MNPLSIVILVIIIIVISLVIIYLIRNKDSSCGCCNGDCKKCQKSYKELLKYYKKTN